ncbi:MAG: TonB-dependent receptor [Haliscomenobacter sp.]|nr:TonB-dependent receptor [Haliscomenobacter sp.]MBP9076695.1 TonB-dependent receptor [Haliscomenobacter sp.]
MRLTLTGMMLLFTMALTAQAVVRGVVTSSEDGEPLIGVTVFVKGTTTGTATDLDGSYEIQVDPATGVLVFSYTGFRSQEVSIGGRTTLDVQLEVASEVLSEVIVTAFGESTREKFTGSATTVNSEQIARRPITNITQAIAGSGAGIQATIGGGQPGSAPAIRIRGFGSVSASNAPLYVVDGIPYDASIANLNPDDIENITVLKDAASTSLYGSRAANGVIMITTKKGAKGEGKINVKYTRGSSQRGLPEFDRLNAAEYYPFMWEAYRNSLMSRASNPLTLEAASADASKNLISLLGYNAYNVPNADLVSTSGVLNPSAQLVYKEEDLDWEKPITREGVRNELNVNFSGGDERSNYFASFAYLDDKGFLIRSDYERYNARLQYNNRIKSWFSTGLNLAYTYTKSNQADADGNTSFVNPFFFSRGMGPIYPVYAYDPNNPGQYLLDGNGNRQYDFGNLNALGLPNRPQYGGRHAIAETELNENFFRRNLFSGRTYGEVSFLEDFKFRVNIGADYANVNGNTFGNPIIGDGAPAGRATVDFTNQLTLNINQQLTYKKQFGKHNVDVLLGHENYDYRDNFITGSRSQLILDGNIELVNFTTTTNLNSGADFNRQEGYFSRVNYDYDNRYFISLSARRDGSSRFYQDVRWGTFFGGSAAWQVHNEAFMGGLDMISKLKLRASYGQTGNNAGIGFYAWQPLFSLGWNNATEAGILQGSLGNAALSWESNNQFDLALEFGLFRDRVTGVVEYFNRESDDLLFSVPLPLSTGTSSQTRNIGAMYNRGLELQLTVEPVRTRNFSWTIDMNATTYKNEITRMPESNKEIISGTKKLQVGSSLYDYWLREWYGVNPNNGDAEYRAVNFVATNSRITETGDTVTTSLNNARFHYNGSAIPDFTGGLTNTFEYKGFSLSVLFIFQVGGYIYDGAYQSLMASSGYGSAKHVDILNRWQKAGDVTDVPRADVARSVDFNGTSDRWLTDATSLNLRNISVSYTFPSNLVKRMKIQGLQVFANGENLALWNKRKGMDGLGSFDGVTSNTYSFYRNFVGGLSLTF